MSEHVHHETQSSWGTYRLNILENPDYPSRQLVFPMDVSVPDYAEAAMLALEKLAELQKLEVAVLLERVLSVRDDALRLRVVTDRVAERSLPLGFAANLVTAAQQMLKAAACTVLKPRVHHPRLTLNEASQLIEKSKFGHTGSGSFVLNLACPLNALDAQGTLMNHLDLPFVRQVTLALRRGLGELVGAIEADQLDAFVEKTKTEQSPLVSSNLCEALTQMHDERLDNTLEINIFWSSLLAVEERDQLTRPLRLQRDYFARIDEVRRELRSDEHHQVDTFVGTVERLEGEMGDDGRRSGDVVLSLLMPEGESIRARASLAAEDYEAAGKAHMRDGTYVQIAGRLEPGRQPRRLSEPSYFQLICPQVRP